MVMSESAVRWLERTVGLSLWREARVKREAARIAPFLDTDYYLENNADVATAGIDASLHYAKYGWREGRDPSPSFSTSGYLSAHPTVAREGINPLLHFVQSGTASKGAPSPVDTAPDDAEVLLVAEHIDRSFYASNTHEHADDDLTAARHYCQFGWRAGADPSPGFSTGYYLTTNPDVRERGINPYWHYLITGRDEGRLPLHPGGWRHRVLSRQTTFDAYCDEWIRDDAPTDVLDAGQVVDLLRAGLARRRLMLSIGHDDYRATPGGVQLCIEIEEAEAARRGFDYLNLHPWQALPKLADTDDDLRLVLVLNGLRIGVARATDIVDALGQLPEITEPAEIVIHHLAGHAPEALVAMAASLGVGRARLWLHDYFTLCTSYALQRNNVSFCGAPAPTSNACGICLFGEARAKQGPRMQTLFDALDIEVVSPSQDTLDFWTSRTALTAQAKTLLPHVELTPLPPTRACVPPTEAPVRLAFIGTPAPHKGWPVFTELQRRLRAEPGYEFWYFGAEDPGQPDIQHVEVHVRASDPEAMLRAIQEHQVDLVLHWASWRETFSFSTFEAMGGGAFVLTNAGSGNVAAAVTALDRGAVLKDTDALYAHAASGGIRDLADRARAARHKGALAATFSNMSFDFLEREQPE